MIEGIGRFSNTQHGFCIVSLCQGKIQDQDFYAFVAIEPNNYPYFKDKYQQGESPCFDAFGRELLRGWGHEPPKGIVEHVRTKYDIEFNIEPQFVERLIETAKNPSFLEVSPLKPAKAS